MNPWIALLGISSTTLIMGLGGLWYARRARQERQSLEDSNPREAIERLAEDLGMTHMTERELMHARVLTAQGALGFGRGEIELYQYDDERHVRLTVAFEETTEQGIHVMLESKNGLLARLLRMREQELGMTKLDDTFILLARDDGRLQDILLKRGLGERLLELHERVDELELGDTALFVYLERLESLDHVKEVYREMLALCHIYLDSVHALGPTPTLQTQAFYAISAAGDLRGAATTTTATTGVEAAVTSSHGSIAALEASPSEEAASATTATATGSNPTLNLIDAMPEEDQERTRSPVTGPLATLRGPEFAKALALEQSDADAEE